MMLLAFTEPLKIVIQKRIIGKTVFNAKDSDLMEKRFLTKLLLAVCVFF